LFLGAIIQGKDDNIGNDEKDEEEEPEPKNTIPPL
jgi:hypothetical protein